MAMHAMIDLETMSTKHNAAIAAVGIVLFDTQSGNPDSKIITTYYANVDLQSCEEKGLHFSGSTVTWWLKQSKEAQAGLLSPKPKPLASVLSGVNTVLHAYNCCVWGNGANFDVPILENAFEVCGFDRVPWAYYQVRCYRTISNLVAKEFFPWEEGTPHNALDDALYQTNRLLAIADECNLNLD